jgi:hypothetical protein
LYWYAVAVVAAGVVGIVFFGFGINGTPKTAGVRLEISVVLTLIIITAQMSCIQDLISFLQQDH